MDDRKLEQTEVKLLLEAMYQRYGFDLRSYARASLDRRLRHFLATSDCNSIGPVNARKTRARGPSYDVLACNVSSIGL